VEFHYCYTVCCLGTKNKNYIKVFTRWLITAVMVMVTKLICTNQTAFPVVCLSQHTCHSSLLYRQIVFFFVIAEFSEKEKPVIPMKKKSTAGLAPNGKLSGCLSQLGGWNQLRDHNLFALRACHTMAGKPRAWSGLHVFLPLPSWLVWLASI